MNGESRITNVAKAGAATVTQREVADAGKPLLSGSSMQGAIVTVSITASRQVQPGATLLSLMEMETHMQAERNGAIQRVLGKSLDRVQAKDLFVV